MNRREIHREIIKTMMVVIPFFIMAKELCRIYYYSPRVFHAIYALRPPRKLYVIHHGAVQLSIPRRRLIALLAADNYRLASLADVVSFLSLRTEVYPTLDEIPPSRCYILYVTLWNIYIYICIRLLHTRYSKYNFFFNSVTGFSNFFFSRGRNKKARFFRSIVSLICKKESVKLYRKLKNLCNLLVVTWIIRRIKSRTDFQSPP